MTRLTAVSFSLTLLAPALCLAAAGFHHDLKVAVDPEKGTISAEDTVTLPEGVRSRALHFLLHEGLNPVLRTPGGALTRERRAPRPEDFLPGEGPDEGPGGVPTEFYRVDLPSGARGFTIVFGGGIRHRIRDIGEEYARGFGQTPGYVGSEGVYLAGESGWVPWLGSGLATFRLDVETPKGWEVVSQGARTLHEPGVTGTRSRWESAEPQDEIYLVGGPLTEYSVEAGRIRALAFLRTPDPALAARYLEATARYLELYSKLLGPYPYPKFALVENFWETGYGMPSFTLLGERIIRFPFILTSSYPHEILHNWWGNGVFVDYASGNWAEGLTAYLSDHLFQEQRGEGAGHRQATLQKYADYAARSKDFPLRAFLSRHSSATEAVGYGKALMFFHMLRRDLGDETFLSALREFYRTNLFRFASYEDLRKAFESVAKSDLRAAFAQWVDRTGAPRLRVEDARARPDGEGFLLTARLEQTQPGSLYRLHVPLAVTVEGAEAALQSSVTLEKRSQKVELRVPKRPLRLDVDPDFDLFRLLDREELPPALSAIFGADKTLIALPSAAPAPLLRAYRALAEDWAGAKPGQVEIRLDTQVRTLPSNRAVWLFGWENRLRGEVGRALAPYGASLGDGDLRVGVSTVPRSGHSAVLAVRHPRNPDLALGWLAGDRPEPLPGLGRKLPHYHKWSYLGFEGDEPANMLKGRWPVLRSPLTVLVADEKGRTKPAERGRLEVRRPLAELPLAFSKEGMLDTIRRLAGEEFQGRALGSPGLDRAAELIAERFREAGLRPGGDGGTSYFQSWTERPAGAPVLVRLRNIIGVLPGKNPRWAGQSVVLGAHYDGQGLGLAGGRSEDRGKIHPGADDNASGVAVLLELARALSGTAPDRTVVFAAFTGEEAGRLGSRRYVAAENAYPATEAFAMLNLDTVGRMEKKLFALGTGSAREWVHVFVGVGYTTGVTVESVASDAGGSDQVSFLERGVPAVQLFTGPHLDYHRPSDTPDKLSADGLLKVAAVAKAAVEYLAARPEPLTRPEAPAAPTTSAGEPGRKVSLGTIPDFAYAGKGVRLAGVVPGSPAERAGLREGDVIVRIGPAAVASLKDLSAALKALQPGDAARVTFEREGTEKTADALLEAR